jgi:hypothetical protein
MKNHGKIFILSWAAPMSWAAPDALSQKKVYWNNSAWHGMSLGQFIQ